MASTPRVNVRLAAHDYRLACEHMLSNAATTFDSPFSEDELRIVDHYAKEVAKMVAQRAKTKWPPAWIDALR